MRMILQEQQKMNATFNRVTENGESMSVILRAG